MIPERSDPIRPDRFEARYSSGALFDGYARARIAQFRQRQIATGIGSMVVWFVVSPTAALACVLLALLGETVDLSVLRMALRRRRRGVSFARLAGITAVFAALQSVTISMCVVIVLTMAPTEEVSLIALCFLMAGAVNAGYALTHHPLAARAKLGVFAGCATLYLLFEVTRHGFSVRLAIHALEIMILGYMVYTFVGFYVRTWNRRIAKEGELLQAAATLDASNRDLVEANRKAEQAARAKSAFLATMSHEIRTPLNAVIGAADLLGDHRLDAEGREYVDTIRQASMSLLAVINDVLDLSRLDAERMTLEATRFSPEACIQGAVVMLRPLARDKDLGLSVTLADDLPAFVTGDEGRMRQIVVNLVGNAIKFTDSGGVEVRAGLSPGTSVVQIDVIDTGIGVPADRAEAIFDTFEQADAATTRRHGGTGLGLPIARALARLMGGDVVLLPPGDRAGATFRLTLDLPAADGAAQAEAEPRPDRLSAPMRVVLAEDNATNRMIVRRFLRSAPVDLIEVENGREAVEAVAWYRPHVVLMDMAMPELDGPGATRAIRLLDGPQPHIVALTANAFATDRAACADAGMDDFLTKPLRRADLMTALVRAEHGEKTLFPDGTDGVSSPEHDEGDAPWTSPRESGTTSGKLIRSSGR